jgi:hypothetical protein
MLTEKKKTGFRPFFFSIISFYPDPLSFTGYIRRNETRYTLTLSSFQGHWTYILTNTLGPAPPPKDKDEPPKEPLVELVRFSTIECEQVLQVHNSSFLSHSSSLVF